LGAAVISLGFSVGSRIILVAIARFVANPVRVFRIGVLLFMAGTIIQIWLVTGVFRGMLRIARRKRVRFDVIFSGGRYLVTVVLAGFVVSLIFVAAYIAIVAMGIYVSWLLKDANVGPLAGVVAMSVYTVFLIYFSARLLQCFFVIIDERAGVNNAIRRSWQLSQRRAGTVVAIDLLLAANFIAGCLCFGVGLFIAIPFNSMVLAVTYLALAGKMKVPRRVPAGEDADL
jgi:hypothetical protein